MTRRPEGYDNRRKVLFSRARAAVLADPSSFTAAGRRLAEIFPAEEVEDLPPGHKYFVEGGGVIHRSLFSRIELATRAACDLRGSTEEKGKHFDFGADIDDCGPLAARMTVLAILLGADRRAYEAISTKICELAALPWDDANGQPGRGSVDWSEGPNWAHGNHPSPRVLDLLDGAVTVAEVDRRKTKTDSNSKDAPDDGEYWPAARFPKGMADRLRQAASPKRKTKRVATRIIDGVVCYSVSDARRWWGHDFPE